MLTIDGGFRESVRKYPENIALRYYQEQTWEEITYAELNLAVNTTARGFSALGVVKGSKVAIMSENRPEWTVCYLATITAGGTAVPIDAQIGEVETEHILNHSGAETLVCSMACYETVDHILSNLDKLKTIILLDRNITVRHEHRGMGHGQLVVDNGRKTNGHKTFLSYDELRGKGMEHAVTGVLTFPEKSPDELSAIIYTSGTTGAAKGVMLTHKNIMTNMEGIKHLIEVYTKDNFLLLLPLHHTFPFTTALALPLTNGASISFVDLMSRDRTRLIMECSPTVIIGVPLLYSKIWRGIMTQIEASKVKSMLYNHGGKKIIGKGLKRKLGGKVRLMVSGAAPMDPAVIEGFVGLGIEFLEGYGLTETSPVVSANVPGAIAIGSVGPPLKGVQVKIDNPDPFGVGEILIKGDNVMQGYYNNPKQTEKVLRDGWFYSGDLGKIDEKGNIHITGRAKDVIVTRGGKNVYPEMVENQINQSKLVSETIVLGYRTAGKVGEDVGLLVSPDYEILLDMAQKEGLTLDNGMQAEGLTEDARDQLIERFRPLLEIEIKQNMEKLAPYQRPNRIAIERDEFTKTSTKKVKRFLYRGRLDITEIEK